MLESVNWAIPAAKEAYDHREKIRKGIEWLTDYLLGKRSSIVFTGMPGVGKTVLYDFLCGNAYSPGYQLPDKSRRLERGAKREGRQRIGLSVIPGDISRPRFEAIDELVLGKEPPARGASCSSERVRGHSPRRRKSLSCGGARNTDDFAVS